MKDMISVIIPIYNIEKYLEECIESVLRQTYDTYEVILVNDGSRDKSREIAERYSNKYKNISLINQENKGLADARNVGLDRAKGEYIYFLDSDDKIDENLFETCMNIFNQNHVDIVHFGYESFNKKGVVRKSTLKNTGVVLSGYDFFRKSTEYTLGQEFAVWSYMYKRKFLNDNKLRFKSKLIYEDAEMFVRVFMNNPKVITINEHFYMYRKREDSITGKKNVTQEYLKSTNKIIDTYLYYMNKNLQLNRELKKYIARFIRVKFDSLVRLEDIDSNIVDREVRDIFNLKNKLNIEIDSIYIEKLKEIMERLNERCIVFDEKDVKNELEVIEKLRKIKVYNIPFNEKGKKIGIYGIGNHTEKMLAYYNKKVHKIDADLILIDSFLEDGFSEKYNLKIANVKNLSRYNLDCIVISAPYSERIMYSNLLKYKCNCKIYRLYDDNNKMLFI